MMQVFTIGLVIAIFVHDTALTARGDEPWPIQHTTLAWLLLAHLLLAATYWAICRWGLHRLSQGRAAAVLNRVDRATFIYRLATLALYIDALWSGLLRLVRQATFDFILLDEAAVIAVPLGMIVFAWWAHYPIDRRLRESATIRHLDQGTPFAEIWTRPQYVLSNIRHQVTLILLPLLALMGWSEIVTSYTPESWSQNGRDPQPWLMLAGSLAVFLLAPLMIRYIWDTAPLPPGQLRDHLTAMCRKHRVGVRELLLWRTFGGMVNGAVMGLIAPLRYILLTDALLEQMPQQEVEAVMAHELAHIKKHHMFWLVAVAVTAMMSFTLAWSLLLDLAVWLDHPDAVIETDRLKPIVALIAALATWLALFGWVSRRFERQADTFAVEHMANQTPPEPPETPNTPPTTITVPPLAVMISALQRVADLNCVPITRQSWRHGSIAWRQAYLRSLADKPTNGLTIHRHIRLIKIATAITAALLTAGATLDWQWLQSNAMWL